jgi:hypothetical protein
MRITKRGLKTEIRQLSRLNLDFMRNLMMLQGDILISLNTKIQMRISKKRICLIAGVFRLL